MTGFGKATGVFKNKKITIEIKSLNSKNLDLFVRMPHTYKSKEIGLRKFLGAQLDRGKVECNINIENNGDTSVASLNTDVIKSYYKQLSDLGSELGIKEENLLQTLVRMPDVFSSSEEELEDEEWLKIMDLAKEATHNLVEFRLQEGKLLTDEFNMRIDNIESSFLEVPKYEGIRIDSIKERIENNLEEFVGGAKVDKNRFEQELIFYIEKIDIAEEKLRLAGHLNYFREILGEPKSQGKKLGFIVQEIGREINTLGSKSYHADMQKLVVQMKDELEKIKEQILNTL